MIESSETGDLIGIHFYAIAQKRLVEVNTGEAHRIGTSFSGEIWEDSL